MFFTFYVILLKWVSPPLPFHEFQPGELFDSPLKIFTIPMTKKQQLHSYSSILLYESNSNQSMSVTVYHKTLTDSILYSHILSNPVIFLRFLQEPSINKYQFGIFQWRPRFLGADDYRTWLPLLLIWITTAAERTSATDWRRKSGNEEQRALGYHSNAQTNSMLFPHRGADLERRDHNNSYFYFCLNIIK